MDFSFTDEQAAFRDALGRFLDDLAPTTEARRLMESETGFDPGHWQRIVGEMGLAGIGIPEEMGGQGFGPVELAMVFEEMGRRLVCVPFLSSVGLAARAVLEVADAEQQRRLLPDIAAGRVRAALAHAEPGGNWDLSGIEALAVETDSGHRLTGRKSFVIDGTTADGLVVAARRPGSQGAGGLSLFWVEASAEGMTRTALPVMDLTRKQAQIDLDAAPALLLGPEGAGAEPLMRALRFGAVMLANEMMGGAEQLRQSALDYAMMRVQFGRPIASFQSMKHKQADMLLQVELARSAAWQAAQALAEDSPDATATAHLAKAVASEACMQTAIHTIQIHGGIGFTHDHDTHLWFKRAKSSEVLLGGPEYHREKMLQNWAA